MSIFIYLPRPPGCALAGVFGGTWERQRLGPPEFDSCPDLPDTLAMDTAEHALLGLHGLIFGTTLVLAILGLDRLGRAGLSLRIGFGTLLGALC